MTEEPKDAPKVTMLPLFYLLDRTVIKPAEDYLRKKLGDVYSDYKCSIRRGL